MARYKPTVAEIVALTQEYKTFYQPWHEQQEGDDKFYNLLYEVMTGDMPDAFDQVRPPTATTIVDMIADHTAGNFPRLHVPRRKETADAQDQTTVMEKAGQGFWYRTLANSPRNILRAWAQSGALRGAIAGSLLYNPDAWPDLPLPSKYGGIDSDGYKEAKAEAIAQRRDAWPFVLDYIDPMDIYPDPGTEGRDHIIHAFDRQAYQVKRAWPNWDMTVPGQKEPLKATDRVGFICYADDTHLSYIVGGQGFSNGGKALITSSDGVRKHGYGFLPLYFSAGGFGSPFGKPEHKYRGILTLVRDLLKLEARRMTHLDAIIAQQAFPWIIAQHGVTPNMSLMGVTRVPPGMKPADAIMEMRPSIPIQELVMELHENRMAIQRSTVPDALGGMEGKSGESGYLRSINVGTGRARIRGLGNSLEMAGQWATSGFYRLVENKVKAPVSTWGKGMDSEQEFVTIKPDDIKGHYEVYVSLVPSLPQDDSVNISNGLKLYQQGAIPIRDLLETYAARENAEELLQERLGEDVLKSPQMMQQMVADALTVTRVTGGPIAVPGFASGEIGVGQPDAASNPASNAGVGAPRSIPTPPAAPGSLQESNNIIGTAQRGGAPTTPQGPLQGIGRGRA
jgi:hypothetical protein